VVVSRAEKKYNEEGALDLYRSQYRATEEEYNLLARFIVLFA